VLQSGGGLSVYRRILSQNVYAEDAASTILLHYGTKLPDYVVSYTTIPRFIKLHHFRNGSLKSKYVFGSRALLIISPQPYTANLDMSHAAVALSSKTPIK